MFLVKDNNNLVFGKNMFLFKDNHNFLVQKKSGVDRQSDKVFYSSGANQGCTDKVFSFSVTKFLAEKKILYVFLLH